MNTTRPAWWRIAAGVAVLLLMVLLAVRLVPAYLLNLKFQRALTEIVERPAMRTTPDDALRAEIVNRAARLGLPVRLEDVGVKRADHRIEIEVLYVVPAELPLYSVDLHFRPRASVP
jgi:hypothetical protein